jgi:hypothetical protein
MKLDADACGVLATVIPVYFLIYYVGKDRLLRVDHLDGWQGVVGRTVILIGAGALTWAEWMAVSGMWDNSGLSGLTARWVMGVALGPVLGVGVSAAIMPWAEWIFGRVIERRMQRERAETGELVGDQ